MADEAEDARLRLSRGKPSDLFDLAALGSAIAVAIVVIVNLWVGIGVQIHVQTNPVANGPAALLQVSAPTSWTIRLADLTRGANNLSALILAVSGVMLVLANRQGEQRSVHRVTVWVVLALAAVVVLGALVEAVNVATASFPGEGWAVKGPEVAALAEAVVLGIVAVGLVLVCERRGRPREPGTLDEV
jgi:hypothetical protein